MTTRAYRCYRRQFPELDRAALARRVCDPIESYDEDWTAYRHRAGTSEQEALARFVMERDARFRHEARAAIDCFDEAGIGSGINAMRFIQAGKPLLGFYAVEGSRRRVNLTSVLELAVECSDLVHLATCRAPEDITRRLAEWLDALGPPR